MLAAAAALCLPMLSADPARAQTIQRTFVSGTGDDANPCTRASPCLTFRGALAKTNINGEINCVDAGDFSSAAGALVIDKSVTIECHDFAAIGFPGIAANVVVINVPTGNANDPLRTVRLRGLRITGAFVNGGVGTRVSFVGILIQSVLHVFVENVLVTQFKDRGINDTRNGSGNLYVRNTVVRDNGGTGIAVVPASGTVDVVIDNSHINRNNFGVSAGVNSRVVVNNSVFMGNAVQGVHADAGGSLSIDRSVINGNVTGVGADAGAAVRIANTDIMFNGTGVSGTMFSFTNNRLVNIAAGTPPTPIGVATSDTGQQ
jgi:hypothetical protein